MSTIRSPGSSLSVEATQAIVAIALGIDAVFYTLRFGPVAGLAWLVAMLAVCRWARWEAEH